MRGFDATRRAGDRGGRARQVRAQPDAGSPGQRVQRPRRPDVRRRRRQPSGLYETPKNNFMPRIGLAFKLNEEDRAPRRLRDVLRLPRPAPRRRDPERLQPDHQPHAVARQRPDVHRHAVESVPERHPGAGRQRTRRRDVPRPEHHLLRSQPEVAAHAAVAGRHPARAARPLGRSRRATSATTARRCRRRATSTPRPTST